MQSTQINLLPWREQQRQLLKTNFLVVSVGFIILSLFIVLLLHIFFSSKLSSQRNRNVYLQTQLTQIQNEIIDLEKKQVEERAFEARLNFIMELRAKSFRAVQLFDELAKTIPTTISLDKIARIGNLIMLEGSAQSELEITQLMKEMTNSKVFNQPVLTSMGVKPNTINQAERFFQLKVEQRK